MLEKIFGKKQIQLSKLLFISLFISMFMTLFVENVVVKMFCIIIIFSVFTNAVVLCYKVIVYYLKKN